MNFLKRWGILQLAQKRQNKQNVRNRTVLQLKGFTWGNLRQYPRRRVPCGACLQKIIKGGTDGWTRVLGTLGDLGEFFEKMGNASTRSKTAK